MPPLLQFLEKLRATPWLMGNSHLPHCDQLKEENKEKMWEKLPLRHVFVTPWSCHRAANWAWNQELLLFSHFLCCWAACSSPTPQCLLLLFTPTLMVWGLKNDALMQRNFTVLLLKTRVKGQKLDCNDQSSVQATTDSSLTRLMYKNVMHL